MVLRILGRRVFLRFVSFVGFDGVAMRANRRSLLCVVMAVVTVMAGLREEKAAELAPAIVGWLMMLLCCFKFFKLKNGDQAYCHV